MLAAARRRREREDAKDKGRTATAFGLTREQCPYPDYSPEQEAWFEGFDEKETEVAKEAEYARKEAEQKQVWKDAEMTGYSAYLNNDRENPYSRGDTRYTWWGIGWLRGHRENESKKEFSEWLKNPKKNG